MSATTSNISNSKPDESWTQDKILLILCGLIASGKSTFAQHLEDHFPQFRRCNQDDLGDRRQVERLTRECLQQGMSVCVDRTNFDASQRAHWIHIAHEFPGTSIWVIVFDTPYEVCASRLRERTCHPTIKSYEQGMDVLSRFASDFRLPNPYEGHDRIIYLTPSDHTSPVYSRAEISTILQRVRDSPPVLASPFHVFRGASYARGRGRYNMSQNPSQGRDHISTDQPNQLRSGWQSMSRYGDNSETRDTWRS